MKLHTLLKQRHGQNLTEHGLGVAVEQRPIQAKEAIAKTRAFFKGALGPLAPMKASRWCSAASYTVALSPPATILTFVLRLIGWLILTIRSMSKKPESAGIKTSQRMEPSSTTGPEGRYRQGHFYLAKFRSEKRVIYHCIPFKDPCNPAFTPECDHESRGSSCLDATAGAYSALHNHSCK